MPSVTELLRVERILEGLPTFRARLGSKTAGIRKRNGETVCFAPETVAVVEALMAKNLNPERVYRIKVLAVAFDVLRMSARPARGAPLPSS